jgi:hypothetical protein
LPARPSGAGSSWPGARRIRAALAGKGEGAQFLLPLPRAAITGNEPLTMTTGELPAIR